MNTTKYIKISPEVLSKDIFEEYYDSENVFYYKPMEYVLQNGLLGDLNLTINLNSKIDDIGFYTVYDGMVETLNKTLGFIISGNPSNHFEVFLYDTAAKEKKFLKDSTYEINWGDGFFENFNPLEEEYKSHFYAPFENTYTITYKQKNKWGEFEVKQKITLPLTTTLTTENLLNNDTILITGFTQSKISELKLYGQVKYEELKPIIKNGEFYGQINAMTSEYTAYTINNIDYYDYSNGQTLYVIESEGPTIGEVVYSGITKEEVLLGVVDSPEIQSDVFIDRGKLSGFESLQRLGEIDNLGDLQNYGYKYFKINDQ